MVSFLYRLARAAAWGRAIAKAASGNPKPILRRARNKYVYFRLLGKYLRR